MSPTVATVLSALGVLALALLLIVLVAVVVWVVMAVVDAVQAERRRQRIATERLAADVRIQRISDEAASQMFSVAREEMVRRTAAQARSAAQEETNYLHPAGSQTIRAQQVWEDESHG